MLRHVSVDAIEPDDLTAFLERCRPPRGEALSEHKAVRVGGADDTVEVVTVDDGKTILGYAQAARHPPVEPGGVGHWAVETAVPPEADRADIVPALAAAIRDLLGEADRVVFWAGDEETATVLAQAGYHETRRLIEMRRELPYHKRVALPDGIELRPFVPGRDDADWLELNNLAFAGHPENGALVQSDLAERMSRPWFHPEGFLLAWERGRLVGSCWTKFHGDAIGEIYIIAVHPDERGRGIGGALLAAGLHHLERRGAGEAMLYTEGDNAAGLELYRSAGFDVASVKKVFEPDGEVTAQPKR